ncbi:MAG: hypothetical protein FWC73_06520 [Defluviitaleaceae bacterium]|nr:hypothetical protein [Defluviitaleaceae bacterium]
MKTRNAILTVVLYLVLAAILIIIFSGGRLVDNIEGISGFHRDWLNQGWAGFGRYGQLLAIGLGGLTLQFIFNIACYGWFCRQWDSERPGIGSVIFMQVIVNIIIVVVAIVLSVWRLISIKYDITGTIVGGVFTSALVAWLPLIAMVVLLIQLILNLLVFVPPIVNTRRVNRR